MDGKFGAWNPIENDMELCDIAAAGDEDEEVSVEEELGDEELGEEGEGVKGGNGVVMPVEELLIG